MMDFDIIFVSGFILVILSIPSILASFSESRWPFLGGSMALIGGALVLWALKESPEGYALKDVPLVLTKVLARLF
jgi:hypothetical protein